MTNTNKAYFMTKDNMTTSYARSNRRSNNNRRDSKSSNKYVNNKSKKSFMTLITKEMLDSYIKTENGAKAYASIGNKLVDFNSNATSFRDIITDKDAHAKHKLWIKYKDCLDEDPINSLKYLLYLRDITEGLGERDTFRYLFFRTILYTGMVELLNVNLENYGRWDDYVELYFKTTSSLRAYYDKKNPISRDRNYYVLNRMKETIVNIISERLLKDKSVLSYKSNDKSPIEKVSLLAKWLPSVKTSSKETMNKAKKLAKVLGMSEREYRNTLSMIRSYLDVVEVKMSSNYWGNIDYERVPSKANLIYSTAFLRHDKERREAFLDKVKLGTASVKTNTLYPYEVICKYLKFMKTNYQQIVLDESLEAIWQTILDNTEYDLEDTLVIRDGSSSMTRNVVNSTGLEKMDVADSITLLAADKCKGCFHNKFITFSAKPEFVDISKKNKLYYQLEYLRSFDDYNTNIEAVFDLILKTAISNNLSQEDLPKRILIVSDMEFDDWSLGGFFTDKTVLEHISDKFNSHGYKLPKLVFWNITSVSTKYATKKNENGLIFVSGFSKSVFKMVISDETDPDKALYSILNTPRYDCIDRVFSICKDNYGKFQNIAVTAVSVNRNKNNNKRTNTNSKKEKSSLKQQNKKCVKRNSL